MLFACYLRRRLVAKERIDALPLILELCQRPALQRLAARQAHAQRIDLGAVDDHLVVQMRAGGFTGRSNPADHLALAYLGAGNDALGNRALVIVGGFIAVSVANDRLVAIAAGIPAGLLYGAITDSD